MDLENLENKEPLIKEFYTWLFDDEKIINKEVALEKEIDFVLAPYYVDANIYYPKQIANFLNTKAMQRLGRISQLDLAIDEFPNVYHNRLEHSKGVYYRKLEEMLHNFQNPLWKKEIETKSLKLHLFAELIKIAGHDIGHLPLSHALEVQIFNNRGIHEIIGQRIMLEDAEIQSILVSISPDLPDVLKDLYKNKILNFHAHDESNYDVDRLDYISRDNLYTGYPIFIPYSHYETIPVLTNSQGHPKTDEAGSIITCNKSTYTIDVYPYDALRYVERLLETRENGYKTLYTSPRTHVRERCITAFFEHFLHSHSQSGKELRNYINTLSSCNINDIDLSLFLDWDDITFYSQILEIAENHENANIRLLATMTVPNLKAFLTTIYSHLGMYAKEQNYSKKDKEFLQKLKSLIKGQNTVSQNLKDSNFISNNTLIFNSSCNLPNSYKSLIDAGVIYTSSVKIKTYNPKEPLYIRDHDDKIYELSQHPNRKHDWGTNIINIKNIFTYTPLLRLNGITDNEIEEMRNFSHSYITQDSAPKKPRVNMQPLQIHHNIEDEFLQI